MKTVSKDESPNMSYQDAVARSGGSYTEAKLRAILMPDLKGRRFLDLGCNAGYYCGLAQAAGATRIVGVDIDHAVIQRARDKHPGVEFVDTGWDIFPEGEFDAVICLSAIHYAKDPILLANNIRDHLSSGGLFILEGGLFDPSFKLDLDILLPVWRQVGDRCRHLSGGFVKNHLLRRFSWNIMGSSEPRGGDPVSRYVIHATPGPVSTQDDIYRLDLIDYATCLSVSAPTISPSLPSYGYVSALERQPVITIDHVLAILADPAFLKAFVDDLVFALGWRRPMKLVLGPADAIPMLSPLIHALRDRKIDV